MTNEKERTEQAVTTLLACLGACAIMGLIFLAAFGIDSLKQERAREEAAIQRQLIDLQCVHVGYRGKSETKIYSCGGRLMERSRDNLIYSN